MTVYTIERRQRVARPLEEVFAFFANAENLDLLTPPWLRFRVLTPSPITMGHGARIEYAIRWRGLPLGWVTQIEEWVSDERFVDVQVRGPYRMWRHTHSFTRAGEGTVIEDVVNYALPLGALGRLAHALLVKRDVERIFDHRALCVSLLFQARQADAGARLEPVAPRISASPGGWFGQRPQALPSPKSP